MADASPAPQLQALVSLASDASAAGRSKLLNQVTELFVQSSDNFNPQEAQHVHEIMGSLARTVDVDSRQQLAGRLGGLCSAPHPIIIQLANDTIGVASPVLVNSPVLEDEDLIKVIGTQTQAHLIAITQREQLSEQVATALADFGSDETLVSLALNHNAQFSRPTAAHLIGRSQTIEPLQAPLIDRTDIPPDLMFQMYWWSSPAARMQLLNLAKGLDPAELEKLLAGQSQKTSNDISRMEGQLSSAQQHIREMVSTETLNQETLIGFLRGGQVPEFVIGFAHMSNLNITTTRRILQDNASESLAMVCQANGFDKEAFSSIETLVYGGRTRTADRIAAEHAVFDQVEPKTAHTALSLWRNGPDSNAPSGEWPPKGATVNAAEYINLPGQKLALIED